jgi:hypothetical protein
MAPSTMLEAQLEQKAKEEVCEQALALDSS